MHSFKASRTKMKILEKIKKLFSRPPKKRVGNIVIYFLDKPSARVYTQEVYGISIYEDREKMLEYLENTVMTTKPRRVRLMDFAVLKNK